MTSLHAVIGEVDENTVHRVLSYCIPFVAPRLEGNSYISRRLFAWHSEASASTFLLCSMQYAAAFIYGRLLIELLKSICSETILLEVCVLNVWDPGEDVRST